MDVTEEVTATLRAEAHHAPVCYGSSWFLYRAFRPKWPEASDMKRSGHRLSELVSVPAAIALENHPADSR